MNDAATLAAQHASEAERLLSECEGRKFNKELGNMAARKANVHATLALYYQQQATR